MNGVESRPGFGEVPQFVSAVPVVDVLRDPHAANQLWPDLAATAPDLLQQIAEHAHHAETVSLLIDKMTNPALDLQTHIEHGIVSERTATEGYESLSQLLLNPDNARLVLYLPFQVLPSDDWQPQSPNLAGAIDDFASRYMAAWYSLLSTHDVRANFDDGDVLESHLRTTDVPRVVKAAHLIPALLAKGLIDEEDILTLYESSEGDDVLQNSIGAGIAVAKEYGLLTPPRHFVSPGRTLNPDAGITSAKRREWLNQQGYERRVQYIAKDLQQGIERGHMPPSWISQWLNHADELTRHGIVSGMEKGIESLARNQDENLDLVIRDYVPMLTQLLGQYDEALDRRITRLFRHSYHLGLISRLESMGMSAPDLSAPLSANIANIQDDMPKIAQLSELLATDPELQQKVYPFVAVGGSRLKGYGEPNSDLDLAVFYKPTASPAERHALRTQVRAAFEDAGIADSPVEFWLHEENDELSVRTFDDTEVPVADRFWTHTLFSTTWVGDSSAIHDVQQKLLPRYFYDTGRDEHGQSDRAFYLERLEQDLLQYRLMHVGYDRHYPRYAQMQVMSQFMIAGTSAFWDPGYRQLATKLFVNNIFLPKI